MIRRIQLDVFQESLFCFVASDRHNGKCRCSGQEFIGRETSPRCVRGQHFPFGRTGLFVSSFFGNTFYNRFRQTLNFLANVFLDTDWFSDSLKA